MKQEQANVEMPAKENVTTTVHESKHFPFQIIEIITTNNNTQEEIHQYKVGVGGAFMSEKVFKTFETAQKYISSRPWELITNLMCFTIQNAFEYEKSQSKR